ncbi:hypothetical protein EV201_0441 [Ancylomarina subtilis]|uniref:Uncharacterized protein n=1 Tax=Ancylomarina subtilis TaxID=1639035 RepID=A0A4Q7VI78_9BACT|nr:hypothetical protein EV201_0441 [Ancylomarina subtilis]
MKLEISDHYALKTVKQAYIFLIFSQMALPVYSKTKL